MYFIITALAAIVATVFWLKISEDKYKLSRLCFIYWGATLMWFVDHVIAFLLEGGSFFEITLDATLLGITVVLCGLLAWGVLIFLKGNKGVINKILHLKI